MRYSVIIPVYNASKTIDRCMNSLLRQCIDRDDIEIILVNDGSTDNSGDKCREYQSQYSCVRVIDKENGGVSSARNAGISIAAGLYYLFVDSDDYVLDNYFIELDRADHSDFVVFGQQIDRKEKVVLHPARWVGSENRADSLRQLINSRNGGPCNKRFRGDIIKDKSIQFPGDLHVGEDFVFCLRYLLESSTSAALDKILYGVDETSETSLTRGYHADSCDQALRIYEYAFSALDAADIQDQEKEQLKALLDYNYYRTAFACVKDLIEQEDNRYFVVYKDIRNILDRFWNGHHSECLPIDNLHRIMRFQVRHKVASIAYAIAKLYSKKNRN